MDTSAPAGSSDCSATAGLSFGMTLAHDVEDDMNAFLAGLDDAGAAVLTVQHGDLGGMSQPALAALSSDLLRAVGEINVDIVALNARRDAELSLQSDRIGRIYAPQIERLDRRRAILEGALAGLAARLDYGKRRTLSLAYGQIGYRTVPAKLVVLDPDVAVEWAKKNLPAAVRTVTKVTPIHKELAKHYGDTGEEPEGCECVAASEALVIKPSTVLNTEEVAA